MDLWPKVLETLDRNWALGVLMVVAWFFWRGVRWVDRNFFGPLGGPDGKIARWFDAQAAQHHATAEASKSLAECMDAARVKIESIAESVAVLESNLGHVESWSADVRAALDCLLRAKACMIRAMGKMPGAEAAAGDFAEAMSCINRGTCQAIRSTESSKSSSGKSSSAGS